MKTRYSKTVLTGAIVLAMSAGLSPPAFSAEVPVQRVHTFSINDVNGGFDGSTYGPSSEYLPDQTDILDFNNYVDDPKSGTRLYAIDSEFGFYVEDFVGAAPKTMDGIYTEGWIGNILDSGAQAGVAVSNAKTDTFKVKYPMGTWCAGLGSNSVKCSTEHYTVLEHVLTCNETIPYAYAGLPTGPQADLIDPATGLAIDSGVVTCAMGALIDDLNVVANGIITNDILGPDPDDLTAPDLVANESTVLDDIAVSTDYGMTKKDDGKPLYRFGNMIKRPNDIRLYARMALPDEWKVEGNDFEVISATLTIEHLITNNPNDQIRPEDMENEGATGRLPGTKDGPYGLVSDLDCYEGDGDFIPEGTLFRNDDAAMGVPDENYTGVAGAPYPFSADLVEGYTNGWYTTTDRDPFANVNSSDTPGAVTVGDLSAGGPRWRLKPNKFGQDIPGLEIPIDECSPVPYSSGNIRYPVGNWTTTTINLLDWETGPDNSPLKRSTGWVDASANIQNYTKDPSSGDFKTDAPNDVSINGLPLTEDFDLAIYIKGDRKATAVYNATLDIVYDDSGVTPPPTPDLVLVSFEASETNVQVGDVVTLTSTVRNDHPFPVDVKIGMAGYEYEPVAQLLVTPKPAEYPTLDPGEIYAMTYDWTVNLIDATAPTSVVWYTALRPQDGTPDDMVNNRGQVIFTVNP